MIQDCRTLEHIEQIIQHSHQQPVWVFKHSTQCPISAAKWQIFQDQAQQPGEFWCVLVIQDRSVSLRLAQVSGIQHESPQVILFRHGQAIWHASRWDINRAGMEAAWQQALV